MNLILRANPFQKLKTFLTMKLSRKDLSCCFLKSLNEINLKPLSFKINLLSFKFNHTISFTFSHHFTKQLFCKHNMISIVSICTVKLTRCELWIMSLINTLISKIFSYLKYLWNTSN